LANVGSFEGRASLSSWLFRIVINRARSRIGREARMVSLDLAGAESGIPGEEDAERPRFRTDGHWEEPPRLWDTLDAEWIVAGRELWRHVQEAIERLPPGPKAVLILRDVEGHEAAEACQLLDISPENQRVLLHRGRDRVRRAIDRLVTPTARAG
jgi:RNA polymerase sigma-70 factor (ECF subfamily)